ncbi:MAG: 4-hydroxythreonine-4-phosphate dehydrogenase PdxA [Nitrospirae bacterium]|nr:MAG: 4-hydroxythreonine-4-phosphate dehydrogenase PdxA [Nitrospirota bacterium]
MPQHLSRDSLPILAITMGDPAGIGPEIIIKALRTESIWTYARPVVLASRIVMEQAALAQGASLTIRPLTKQDLTVNVFNSAPRTLPILDPFDAPLPPIPPAQPSAAGGRAAVQCIHTAVRLAQAGIVDAIVTAPINKRAMQLAGYDYPGHTEMLADLTGAKRVGMMIVGGGLKVLFVTTHVALRKLPDLLSATAIVEAIELASTGLRDIFKLTHPRIGVAGLNPHAGENGLFGDEEERYIVPAVREAQAKGIDCTGPLPADTLFGKAVRGAFDGIVAMYHDQGLIALKTVAFGRCVNLTVGLPIIRTSVDHGTAYDIAGKGVADPASLLEAMALGARLAAERRSSMNP